MESECVCVLIALFSCRSDQQYYRKRLEKMMMTHSFLRDVFFSFKLKLTYYVCYAMSVLTSLVYMNVSMYVHNNIILSLAVLGL